MEGIEKPDGWSDEDFANYFGSETDPEEDAPVIGGLTIVEVAEIQTDGGPPP